MTVTIPLTALMGVQTTYSASLYLTAMEMLPGQPEFRNAEKCAAAGIPVDDTNWRRIGEAAKLVGLDPAEWEGLKL